MRVEEFIDALQSHQVERLNTTVLHPVVFSAQGEYVEFNPAKYELRQLKNWENSELIPLFTCSSWKKFYDVMVGNTSILDVFASQELSTNGYLPTLYQILNQFQPKRPDQLPE